MNDSHLSVNTSLALKFIVSEVVDRQEVVILHIEG